MRYDVIITGSGLGGLEVALMMADSGKRVLVLEKQHQPGGCMQSYRRGRLHLDTGLHYVGGLDKGNSLYQAFDRLGLMQLPWQQMDRQCFEEITISGKTFTWPQGIDTFISQMQQYFPSQSDGLDKYRQLLQSNDEEFLQKTNAWDYLHSIISDELLIQVLSAPATCKMELRKETLPLFTFVHGTASFIESSWRLNGDGNAIVDILVNQIRQKGGEVLTDKQVVELVESEGRITQAVCQDGSRYEGTTFVCDTHPVVATELVRQSMLMKKIFRRRMATQENTFGIFTVQVQLKPQTLKYFNHNKLVFTTNSCWDMAVDKSRHVEGVMVSCRIPEQGEYAQNIDILTPMLWEAVADYADSTLFHRPEAYKQLKQQIAQQCIELASTRIPGFEGMIEIIWTSTPLTYRDYNGSVQGSAFGFRKDSANPLMTIISPKTPIPNLYMTGQSLMLHGLHGVTMTAGYTAQAITESI